MGVTTSIKSSRSKGSRTLFDRFRMTRTIRQATDLQQLQRRREQAESNRRRAGEEHVVEYFHQLDDPYSHLAVQCLQGLLHIYDIRLRVHLVGGNHSGLERPAPTMLNATRDCVDIAPHYGLEFPDSEALPKSGEIEAALALAAASRVGTVPQTLVAVGKALWTSTLPNFCDNPEAGAASDESVAARLESGNARLRELGGSGGAMFWYAGEWYWGVDRLYHLEDRLTTLGARRTSGRRQVAPRPVSKPRILPCDNNIALEFFADMGSPYTAAVYHRVIRMAREAGFDLIIRPVPGAGDYPQAARSAQSFADASREARAAGRKWSRVADPTGKPAASICALLPLARQQHCEQQLLNEYFDAVYERGANVASIDVLREITRSAGLDWQNAQQALQSDAWRLELSNNKRAMPRDGLQAAPAFRLLDESGNTLFETAGHDRLWLVAQSLEPLSLGKPRMVFGAKEQVSDEVIDIEYERVPA